MALLLKKEGLFTSLQGLGKFGFRRSGIGPLGAMDRTAARLANLLLGNDDGASVLEFHFPAPEILFESNCRFALGGADFSAELDGRPIGRWCTQQAKRHSILRFARKTLGNRGYIAVQGGLRAETAEEHAFTTCPLKKGERLLVDPSFAAKPETPAGRALSPSLLPRYSRSPIVRLIAGAEFGELRGESRAALENAVFNVTNESNRMGFRLSGPSLGLLRQTELVSRAVSFGTMQLLPNGQVIILMADHQTTGGYPHVGHVISVDLPLVAQLGPGDSMTFDVVDVAKAEELSNAHETDLRRLKVAVDFGRYW